MKTRHAALIRKGILAARDPELSQYVHLAPRLVREAARREMEGAVTRAETAAKAANYRLRQELLDYLIPTGNLVIDAHRRRVAHDLIGSRPQRAIVGIDPAAINAEHLRRFYA